MNEYRAITGVIQLRTALHIGIGQGDAATDAVCRKNSRGQWLLPGTALGGAMRSLATRLAPRFSDNGICRALLADAQQLAECKCIVCQLFGFRFLDATPDSQSRPSASRLYTADAVAIAQTHTRIRDGVGINRTSQSAERAGASKFDYEVVPAGTEFELRIELEENLSPEHEILLAAVLSEWQAGRAALGGRSARGLGGFALRDFKFISRPLQVASGLLAFLSADAPWQVDQRNLSATNTQQSNRSSSDTEKSVLNTAQGDVSIDRNWIDKRCKSFRALVRGNQALPEPVAGSFWSVEIKLQCDGPMVVNDPAAAALAGYDFVPYLEQLQHGSQLVLPGASIRGVLRSQAERIALTIASQRASDQSDSLAAFLAHCPACDPSQNTRAQAALANCQLLVKEYAKSKPNEAAQRTHGAMGFDPEQVPFEQYCPACQLFGSSFFGSRLRCEDAHATCTDFHAQDFLKIDRFTGGGVDGAKFDAIAAWKPEWNLRIFLENPRAEELAWLSFVLKDLQAGLLRMGFGGSKGFGRVFFEAATLRLGYLHPSDLNTLLKTNARVDQVVNSAKQEIYDVLSFDWNAWLKLMTMHGLDTRFRERIYDFERKAYSSAGKHWHPMRLTKDSYFDVQAAPDSSIHLSEIFPMYRTSRSLPTKVETEGTN